jgi:phosphoribosylglycinamide formyltransferase-1
MAKARLAILISGRGTNLQSLIDATAKTDYPAEIALVISNRAKAAGLARAESARIPTEIIDHRPFGEGDAGRTAFDAALTERLKTASIDYICLAGFMRMLTPAFVEEWHGRLINIHPSLLPAFKGLDVHQRMLDAGVKVAGCTVHFVSAEMDSGPIIGQAAVPVLPGDDPETLAARILAEEHRLYPACVRLVAEGKARLLPTGVVAFDATVAAGAALHNPQTP